MAIEYACTHVSKESEVDHFEKGCIGKRTCVMDDRCDIVAYTLPDLLRKIEDAYGLEFDSLFIPDPESGSIDGFGFNRLEDGDGDVPSKDDIADWKQGKVTLYLADYHFAIECRAVLPIPLCDLEAAGFPTH